MKIVKATPQDFVMLYDLWKKNRKKLGPCWKVTLEKRIGKGEYYYALEEDKCIGMVCMHYSKKYVRYELDALVISDEYRHRGYGTKLVKYVVDKTRSHNLLDECVPVYLSALEGDENNQFYDRFCTVEWYNHYKTCTTRIYKVDRQKLKTL